jgi:hypothetical protein
MVTRNVYAAGQDITLSKTSSVKGDIFFGVQKIDLSGVAGRDLAGAGENIVISGSLARNALVNGSKISLTDTGKIGGNLDYFVEKENTASFSSTNVKGKIVRH